MTKKLLQIIANYIVRMLETCDKQQVEFWYERGLWVNQFCIDYFDLYLD